MIAKRSRTFSNETSIGPLSMNAGLSCLSSAMVDSAMGEMRARELAASGTASVPRMPLHVPRSDCGDACTSTATTADHTLLSDPRIVRSFFGRF